MRDVTSAIRCGWGKRSVMRYTASRHTTYLCQVLHRESMRGPRQTFSGTPPVGIAIKP